MSRISTTMLALALTVGVAGTASAQWGQRNGSRDHDRYGDQRSQQAQQGEYRGSGYGNGLPSRLDPRLFQGIRLTRVQIDNIRTIDDRYQQYERQYDRSNNGRAYGRDSRSGYGSSSQQVSAAELRDVRAALGPREREVFDSNLSALGSGGYGYGYGSPNQGNNGRGYGHGYGRGGSGY